jgi:hypothetical protein
VTVRKTEKIEGTGKGRGARANLPDFLKNLRRLLYLAGMRFTLRFSELILKLT